MQHCILLRDKLVTKVVIRATEGFNLQCNNVARQVEEKRYPFYRAFKAGVHVKAVLTSLNTAFLPISRSRFSLLIGKEIFFFSTDRLN